MLKAKNPTQTAEWKALSDHFEKVQELQMKTLFQDNPDRFRQYSIQFNDILVDYLKTSYRMKPLTNS